MDLVKVFTFNPFQENTIVLRNADGECIIFDPGCYDRNEREELKKYIDNQKLTPVKLINTHGHLDHVFGNAFIYDTYDLKPELHKDELKVLQTAPAISSAYGVPFPATSPDPEVFIAEGDVISFGEMTLKTLLCPGHSPASLCFYIEQHGILIGGDVLFRDSIGRTDLPGGDHNTLLNAIKTKVYTLPDETVVYPGHGPTTTVGYEKKHNPFVRG